MTPEYVPTLGLTLVEGRLLDERDTQREVERELEPSAPLSNVATMTARVDRSLARSQSLSLLVTSFAAVALLLSVVGIYG